MKKFDGLLFCTDLDGTLYSDDKTISRQNLDAIEYFKAQGGRFTFITGRIPATSKAIYDSINPNAPFGCFNGGAVYDGEKDTYLWHLSLSKDAEKLVEEVEEKLPDIGIQPNTDKRVYFSKDNSAMVRFREITGLENLCCPYKDIQEPILKVVFGHEEEEQIRLLAELLNAHPLSENFDFIRSEQTLYEILPKGASKGRLLLKLAELLGIEPSKTIAVGDFNNDVSMVRAAGLGFAVANAVDEVKAVADHITVSNNENAIATIIEGLDNGTFTL